MVNLQRNKTRIFSRNYVNVTGAGIAMTALNQTNQPGIYQDHTTVTMSGNTVLGSMHPVVIGAATKVTFTGNNITDGACYPFIYNVRFNTSLFVIFRTLNSADIQNFILDTIIQNIVFRLTVLYMKVSILVLCIPLVQEYAHTALIVLQDQFYNQQTAGSLIYTSYTTSSAFSKNTFATSKAVCRQYGNYGTPYQTGAGNTGTTFSK